MARNVFEEMDARAAQAVGRLLEEPCIWRPYKARGWGGAITRQEEAKPDPDRPVIEGLSAIPTFRPGVADAADGKGGASMAGGQLVIDIERSEFGVLTPIKGDRLELINQRPGERIAEIVRVSDDGSARLLFVCQVLSS